VFMIVDFLTQTLNMYVNGTGITNVFISPDLVKKLFTGKYMVRGRGKEIQKLQLLRRHFNRASHIEDRVVGLINNQIRIFHTSDIGRQQPVCNGAELP